MPNRIGVPILLAFLTFVTAHASAASPALKAAPDSQAAPHVEKGVLQYNQSYWSDAQKYFAAAVNADPKSAEAHYDLALALDKLGDHKGATEHFIKAYQLGKANPDIQNSPILKAHLR